MYSRMNAIIKRIVKSTKPKNCDKIYFMNGIAIPKDKSSVPDFNYKILINRNITAPALGRWRVDKEKVEEVMAIQGATTLYASAREMLMTSTSRMGYGPFILPTMSFHGLKKD